MSIHQAAVTGKEEFARCGDAIYDRDVGPLVRPEDERQVRRHRHRDRALTRSIETSWLHPIGFSPEDSMPRRGQDTSGHGMPDDLDLATGSSCT